MTWFKESLVIFASPYGDISMQYGAGIHCEYIHELEDEISDAEEAMMLQEKRFNRIASCVDALLKKMENCTAMNSLLEEFQTALSAE